jgi:hypothetical protein
MGALHQSPRQRRIFSDWPRKARHNRGPASGLGPLSSVDVEGLFEQKVRHAVGAYSWPVHMGLYGPRIPLRAVWDLIFE